MRAVEDQVAGRAARGARRRSSPSSSTKRSATTSKPAPSRRSAMSGAYRRTWSCWRNSRSRSSRRGDARVLVGASSRSRSSGTSTSSPAAGAQHAVQLGHRRAVVLHVLEHVAAEDRVEGAVLERQRGDVQPHVDARRVEVGGHVVGAPASASIRSAQRVLGREVQQRHRLAARAACARPGRATAPGGARGTRSRDRARRRGSRRRRSCPTCARSTGTPPRRRGGAARRIRRAERAAQLQRRQVVERPRLTAISPVRTISISPNGRILLERLDLVVGAGDLDRHRALGHVHDPAAEDVGVLHDLRRGCRRRRRS